MFNRKLEAFSVSASMISTVILFACFMIFSSGCANHQEAVIIDKKPPKTIQQIEREMRFRKKWQDEKDSKAKAEKAEAERIKAKAEAEAERIKANRDMVKSFSGIESIDEIKKRQQSDPEYQAKLNALKAKYKNRPVSKNSPKSNSNSEDPYKRYGKLISYYKSDGYKSITYKKGNVYTTITTTNGKVTKSTYISR